MLKFGLAGEVENFRDCHTHCGRLFFTLNPSKAEIGSPEFLRGDGRSAKGYVKKQKRNLQSIRSLKMKKNIVN